MRLTGNLKNEPCTLALTVVTRTPKKFFLQVRDRDKPNTVYTSRYATIEDKDTFYVRMPLSPEVADIVLMSESEKNGGGKDNDYRIELKKIPLLKKLNAFSHANPVISSFVKFAEEFSEKAGYISAGSSIYTSDDGRFRIDYLDDILDRTTGKDLKTPARISKSTGVIEISRNKFLTYTVPQRMAILLHEFSHFYLNEDAANEIEADLNALLIYLGLGYPRIDAMNVFINVFSTAPSEQNKDRIEIIDKFLTDFEKEFESMSYDKEQLKRMEKRTKKKADGQGIHN